MLVFLADLLEMRNMYDNRIIDVLELLGSDIYDGLVVNALHLNIDVGEALIVLEVAVFEIDLVPTLKEFSVE